LELSYLEYESAALAQAFNRRVKSHKEPLTEINVAISALYSNLHITTAVMNCANESRSMDIIVDGRLYGPYNTIRVQALKIRADKFPVLPVMTYLEPEF
jgi:endonuclease V-like protein UPF0215 family